MCLSRSLREQGHREQAGSRRKGRKEGRSFLKETEMNMLNKKQKN